MYNAFTGKNNQGIEFNCPTVNCLGCGVLIVKSFNPIEIRRDVEFCGSTSAPPEIQLIDFSRHFSGTKRSVVISEKRMIFKENRTKIQQNDGCNIFRVVNSIIYN